MKNLYEIIKLNEDTWQIRESGFINMYLLVGTKKALLIDTGNGSLRLPEIIRTLTNLPLTVIATHNHCDHVGGAGWFKKVWVHEEDMDMNWKWSYSPISSRMLTLLSKKPYHFEKQPNPVNLVFFKGDGTFHLGERDVQVIHLPGHTKGSVILLDESRKQIFVGDNAGSKALMLFPGTAPISTWVKSLKAILDLMGDCVPYWGHDQGKTSRKEITELYDAACSLVANTKHNSFIGRPASWPKGKGKGKISYNTKNVLS